jgi:hypothetical protein
MAGAEMYKGLGTAITLITIGMLGVPVLVYAMV